MQIFQLTICTTNDGNPYQQVLSKFIFYVKSKREGRMIVVSAEFVLYMCIKHSFI